MPQALPQPTLNKTHEPTLTDLVADIQKYEAIIAGWEADQQAVVDGLKDAIATLHRAGLTRLVRSVKASSLESLKEAVQDEVVYGLLRFHGLVRAPQPPLAERLEQALAEVRPGLKSHGGDVELVALHPPDTVEVRLMGTCSHCPASTLTLKQGVEQAIKAHCPEITQVIAVAGLGTGEANGLTSPFVPHPEAGWRVLTTLSEIPEAGVLPLEVDGLKLLLTRQGSAVKAYRDSCTHLARPFEGGVVRSGVLTCPHHGFQYQLATGACLTTPEMPLQPFPVEVRGERVWVQLQ